MLVEENGKLKSVHLDTTHVDTYRGRGGFIIGEKLILQDPHLESAETPLFVHLRGFYSDDFFSSDDDHILEIKKYRKLEVKDRTFLSQSKYPNTEDLRDYNNWKFFSQMKRKESDMKALAIQARDMQMSHGIDTSNIDLTLFHNFGYGKVRQENGTRKTVTEFIPRHLHYDDFLDKWNGRIDIRLASHLYRSENKYGGIVIDSNFRPGNSNFLDGINWFNNSEWYMYGHRFQGGRHRRGDSIWEDAINDLFLNAGHPDIEIYAVLDRSSIGRHGTLEMWDLVKDIVKVEKILGNVSFLSEFGYICTMDKYSLMIGENWDMKRKYCLI